MAGNLSPVPIGRIRTGSPTGDGSKEDLDGWSLELDDAEQDKQITVVFRICLADERLKQYRKWHEGIIAKCREFDGYLGTTALEEPSERPGESVHFTISRWSSGPAAMRWKTSHEREESLEALQSLQIGSTTARYDNQGSEAYFLLGENIGRKRSSRWESFKMFAITWLVVWSHALFVDLLFLLMPAGFQDVPLQLRLGLATCGVTLLMHYLTFSRVLGLAQRFGILEITP